MKKTTTLMAFAMCAFSLTAQDLPRPSPAAKVEQRVGLTDISVEYFRPGIKGREIWGGLVPYDELWRTGANKATQLTLSAPAVINGLPVEAGSYSLFVIPREAPAWEVIINRNTELWGTSDYNEEEDVVRFEADVREVPYQNERMEFRFIQVDMSTAELALDWAGKQMVLMIEADPSEQVMDNIQTALEEAEADEKWRVYRTAASYAEDVNMTEQGLEWIKASVKLKESWYGYWVYGNLLAQQKDYKGAVEKAKKAQEIGRKEFTGKEESFPYDDRIGEDIARWKKMM